MNRPTDGGSAASGFPARLGPLVVVVIGAGMMTLAIGVDMLRREAGGEFGGKQFTLTLVGALLVLMGGLLLHPGLRGRLSSLLARWREGADRTREAVVSRPVHYIVFGLCFGLLTGLVEVAWVEYAARVEFYTKFTDLSRHHVWMAPLTYVVLFGAAGCLVTGIARSSSRWMTPHVAFVAYSFLLFFSLLQTVRGLHDWAVTILSMGLAAQFGRVAIQYLQPLRGFAVRATPALAVIAMGLAANEIGGVAMQEARVLAGTQSATGPNVLLVILDTVRARSLGLYGYGRDTTPQIERFAQTGTVFERAFSTSPWTLPSHATIFTGRLPGELSTAWLEPLDATYPTLAEYLTDHGYSTAGFVANFAYGTAEHGLARGFVHYEDRQINLAETFASASLGRWTMAKLRLETRLGTHENFRTKSADRVNADFLSWLDGRGDEKPFFAFLNYFDAHDPYLSPPRHMRRFSPARDPKARLVHNELGALTEADIAELIDAYDGTLAYLDEQLGILFDELGDRGELQNTMVVITSDHGEQFGEHGIMFHSNSLYLPTLHVPLVISYPEGLPSGARSTKPVSLRDLPATIVSVLGLEEGSPFPGRPLELSGEDGEADAGWGHESPLVAEIDKSQPIYPEWYPAMKGPLRSVISEGLHYIINYGDGQEELFDLSADIEEERDLSSSPDWAEQLGRLRQIAEGIPHRSFR